MNDFLDLETFAGEVLAENAALNLYCLIDQGGMPGVYAQLRRHRIRWMSLLADISYKSRDTVSPILILMNQASPGLLRWIGSRGTFSSTLIFLVSPLQMDEMATRLVARLDAKVSQDLDMMLRFFDPRVFEQLLQSLTRVQAEKFLGVANAWWFVDRRGAMNQVCSQFHLEDSYAPPLTLTATQEFEMLDACEPDQISSQLLELMPAAFGTVDIRYRYDFVVRQMQAGTKLKLSSTGDLTVFTVLALALGEGFHNERFWEVAFQEIEAGLASLMDKVAHFEHLGTA